jgi:hypothetical protein
MKKLTPLLLTLALSAGLALPAMAQGAPEIGTFESFLNSHPNTARELQANPSLINDPQWMGHHQGLEEYMSNHPDVRADVHENPGAFVNNGGHWSWNNPGYNNNRAAENFDTGYLDKHPEISQQLARNPGLADNPQYLSAHPGLQDYLNAHPNVHYDLEHHPDRFMSDEDRMNGHPNGAYASEGYHPGPPPPGAYHEEHPTAETFAAEHPYAAEHPQAAKQYYQHHHHQ